MPPHARVCSLLAAPPTTPAVGRHRLSLHLPSNLELVSKYMLTELMRPEVGALPDPSPLLPPPRPATGFLFVKITPSSRILALPGATTFPKPAPPHELPASLTARDARMGPGEGPTVTGSARRAPTGPAPLSELILYQHPEKGSSHPVVLLSPCGGGSPPTRAGNRTGPKHSSAPDLEEPGSAGKTEAARGNVACREVGLARR